MTSATAAVQTPELLKRTADEAKVTEEPPSKHHETAEDARKLEQADAAAPAEAEPPKKKKGRSRYADLDREVEGDDAVSAKDSGAAAAVGDDDGEEEDDEDDDAEDDFADDLDLEDDLEALSEPEVTEGSRRRRPPVDYKKVLEEMEKEEKRPEDGEDEDEDDDGEFKNPA